MKAATLALIMAMLVVGCGGQQAAPPQQQAAQPTTAPAAQQVNTEATAQAIIAQAQATAAAIAAQPEEPQAEPTEAIQAVDAEATGNAIIANAQATAQAITEAANQPEPTEVAVVPTAVPEVAVMPTAVTVVEPTEEPQPAEAEISVALGKWTLVEDEDIGSSRIIGFVTNKSRVPVAGLEVIAEVINARQKTVGTGTSVYARAVVPAGERSPFYVVLQ
nr:hypothetical protein [Chloroflexota bacterium]